MDMDASFGRQYQGKILKITSHSKESLSFMHGTTCDIFWKALAVGSEILPLDLYFCKVAIARIMAKSSDSHLKQKFDETMLLDY